MNILTVRGLCKQYPGFALDHVSFSLRQGSIMGLIGRNGAGKTTTLKSLLHLVHPTQGEIAFFGKSFRESELEIKRRIGFASGGVNYYPRKKLKTITAVTRRFYPNWDEAAYRRYLDLFQLPEEKTPSQLSEGMKVKYSLALALSHRAEVLLLDEPTSGLDPVSREELLDIFLDLARDKTITILFSTHITSDLEKCADDITYIQRGTVPYTGTLKEFLASYRLVRIPGEPAAEMKKNLLGCKREKEGWSALLSAQAPIPTGAAVLSADLDSIMVHLEHAHRAAEAGEVNA